MDALETIIGECRTYSDRVDTHDHAYAQLLLPLYGSLFIQTEFQEFELQSSHVFFLLPHCQHTFYAKDCNQFLVLDIPKSSIFNLRCIQQNTSIKTILDDRWQALRQLLLAEINQSQYSLTDLFRYAERLLQLKPQSRSIQYLQENYHQSITLPELAKLEGYNTTYYCEWFKFTTGSTVKQYIQTLRFERAKHLLQATDWSVTQIAHAIGYEHPASLTRLFRQFSAFTPQAYRQHSRNSATCFQNLAK
ncbi:helix-turn-helix domain-containing protein [Thermocoleostomius sinensis]|uniref:AraC family transcriptional regulator n=1 Tax=Thermocoleostomius sinensis A174 TaxID=2016057 RepID=A0A9E8ZFY8_9CYAN|nr:AraC family transcriptional regulator [Thermocoleostomius sinensis]WAL61124.1 AraC family transcriptional regulator [Thermocoleostomius sinensis A174]